MSKLSLESMRETGTIPDLSADPLYHHGSINPAIRHNPATITKTNRTMGSYSNVFDHGAIITQTGSLCLEDSMYGKTTHSLPGVFTL